MTFEEEIAARCFKFEEEFKMNKLGLFLLKQNDVKAIEMSEVDKKFFLDQLMIIMCLAGNGVLSA